MMKAEIKAAEAAWPYNTYDSILETPGGKDPRQNAWLTLQLRVKLNFVDSKNPLPGLTQMQGTQLCARDHDGYLFPLLDWPPHLIARFQREYVALAEKTWNWQFLLVTPKSYDELDYTSFGPQLLVRPNVLCLFRMSVHSTGGPIDTSPAAGPLRAGTPHRTINVVNLALSTRQVSLAPGVAPTPTKPATRAIGTMNGLSFRSNDVNYDDSDLFNPAWWQKEHNVISNTVGHEVGHALGQCHIMGLKGDPQYQFGGVNSDVRAAYGVGSADPNDSRNVMGGGNRIYLINAVSWRERIALHTGLPAAKWEVTGMMNIPPRSLPLGIVNLGTGPKEW
ncbi:MAG TPA: hypothetical protein VE914_15375 [Candidatus Angelobacter sp.]|nr:hypothetical protein [Candidatus Angelobacter sp.]